MKNLLHNLQFLFLLISLFLISCGPGKKLVSSQARVGQLQNDNTNVQNQLTGCNSQVLNLNDSITALKNEYDSVKNDLSDLSTVSKMTIAFQAKRLKSLQNLIQMQNEIMTKLKTSISDALINYKTDELFVYVKDGKVYVSLEEKLLFKSGSDIVDPKGKEALKALSVVLNSTQDINVMIEGHTDNVPIKTRLFKDNWDLSTARATSILRILIKEDGFDSNRITASGKGEFHPIKTNETPEGRAGNRRTEIILSPDLNEIYKLLNQQDMKVALLNINR
ncbi:MAG: flagellar motor protein MotB [Bacteroidales bacterium]|nr:flagellar motor protein MotB [Bacteroidales bacterium]MBK8882972.1 flagellar motor protein MotB [Bacteroidales bacterium]